MSYRSLDLETMELVGFFLIGIIVILAFCLGYGIGRGSKKISLDPAQTQGHQPSDIDNR